MKPSRVANEVIDIAARRPLLRVAGVEVTYPNGVCALQPTTLTIAQGEFVVLLDECGDLLRDVVSVLIDRYSNRRCRG